MQRLHEAYADSEYGLEGPFITAASEIQYDMLYGDRYIFRRIVPYKATNMKLGIDKIVLHSVEFDDATGNILIKGKNFTPFSKVLMDDERLETTYVDRNTIMVIAGDTSEVPPDGARFEVAQIDKDKHELTRTNAIIYHTK